MATVYFITLLLDLARHFLFLVALDNVGLVVVSDIFHGILFNLCQAHAKEKLDIGQCWEKGKEVANLGEFEIDRAPWVVGHEVESVEKRDHRDAWVEPESAVEQYK